MMTVITLTTDFGVQDEYVGVLKGVIACINPHARVIDLTHGIDPQDIIQAAYLLRSAYTYFPTGTIHLAVVDPGVGSHRSIIVARYCGYLFVAPDNGLLGEIWGADRPDVLVQVTNESFFLHPISRTFHGRDVFAPVAAHLSRGIALQELGPAISSIQLCQSVHAEKSGGDVRQLQGQVISIDRFGNLITSITATQLGDLAASIGPAELHIRIGRHLIRGLSHYYGQTAAGEVLALIGSRALLEIAVNGDNAASILNLKKGAVVRVSMAEPGD